MRGEDKRLHNEGVKKIECVNEDQRKKGREREKTVPLKLWKNGRLSE